ncbi:MAG TPA: hypothetical protein VGI81_06240 [Tepidisphaeraceae bacterium]
MSEPTIEDLCELGQEQLMETRYLEAEATLVRAAGMARAAGDWDRLSRLYMPLQETRRQRRQRCGEGIVRLDLLAEGPDDVIDPRHVLEHDPHGQLLVAGWGTLEPARAIRAMAAERALYVETFLAAVYPVNGSRVVVIAPFEDAAIPALGIQSVDELTTRLPDGCLVLPESELPHGSMKGTPQTYGRVMAMWERLHAPFLAGADAEQDLLRKVEFYGRTIAVDYACELAHQKLAAAARELTRRAGV